MERHSVWGNQGPIELYDLDADIGETHNVADGHPDIVAKITAIMEKARANSEFNRFWPLPSTAKINSSGTR